MENYIMNKCHVYDRMLKACYNLMKIANEIDIKDDSSDAGISIYDCDKNLIYESKESTMRDAVRDAIKAGKSFCGADLSNSDLSGLDPGRALVLTGADLSGSSFSHANLSRSIFDNAKLYNANLSGANLSRVDFSGANLTNADISGANLAGADFSFANLGGANLTGADFGAAKGLSTARLEGVKGIDVLSMSTRAPIRVWVSNETGSTPLLKKLLAECNENYVPITEIDRIGAKDKIYLIDDGDQIMPPKFRRNIKKQFELRDVLPALAHLGRLPHSWEGIRAGEGGPGTIIDSKYGLAIITEAGQWTGQTYTSPDERGTRDVMSNAYCKVIPKEYISLLGSY